MATAIKALVGADGVEESLIALDADYTAVYGPDLTTWSRGVRGEFFSQCITQRARYGETFPQHPRRSSAGRRRRHCKQLPFRIREIAPGAESVLLTPVWSDARSSMERIYVIRALDAAGEPIRLPVGGSRRLTALMQGAFPGADWDRPQTWHADTNSLTTWGQASRDFRDSDASGFIESDANWAARVMGGKR